MHQSMIYPKKKLNKFPGRGRISLKSDQLSPNFQNLKVTIDLRHPLKNSGYIPVSQIII